MTRHREHMTWSWRLTEIAGIEIRVHATFPILLVWVAASTYVAAGSIAAAVSGMLLICVLFAIVVLHEMGHALMARRFGIATKDITLLPIGGVARLERMPERPRDELLVAVAGPAVNVVLAAAFFALAWLSGARGAAFDLESGSPLLTLAWINVALATFNLVPAFPMDGGRALRAILAMRLPAERATRIAARLGQSLAFVLGFVGLLGNPMLVFIALFVWLGAAGELRTAEVRHAVEGVPVHLAMAHDAIVLAPEDSLATAVEISVGGFQHDFAVVEGGAIVGMLSRADLLRAVSEHGTTPTVGSAMSREFSVVRTTDDLVLALEPLESGCGCLPVVDERGTFAGLLTMEGVGELLAFRTAIAAPHRAFPRDPPRATSRVAGI
jgi:Zn-dependent protease/CBS domain-containing protein